jgi:hypothetical protein
VVEGRQRFRSAGKVDHDEDGGCLVTMNVRSLDVESQFTQYAPRLQQAAGGSEVSGSISS